MKTGLFQLMVLGILLVAPIAAGVAADDPEPDETAVIKEIVRDSIAWALNKDRARLEEIIAHDEDFFSYHPDSLVPVHGWTDFKGGFNLWMDDRFVATHTDVRNFRCHFSRSGTVAWFSAILDDCYEWDGNPGCWKDTRWTGVLEKQDGRWVIMQQHFSFAADRVAEEVRAEMKAGSDG